MIDLSKLDPDEAERIAYTEGFTGVAALYARLSDAEHLASALEDDLEDKISTLEDDLEDMRQTLLQCLPFFEDWKETMGEDDIRSMEFMIRLIKQSLWETI